MAAVSRQRAHIGGEAAVAGERLPPRAQRAEHEQRQEVQLAQAQARDCGNGHGWQIGAAER
jgi:hypothetical protein